MNKSTLFYSFPLLILSLLVPTFGRISSSSLNLDLSHSTEWWIGVALPANDFSDSKNAGTLTNSPTSGCAQIGGALGGRYLLKVGSGIFAWDFDGSAFFNPLSTKKFMDPLNSNATVKSDFWWFTGWLLTGPRLTIAPSIDISIFGSGLLGIVIARAPNLECKSTLLTTSFAFEPSAAFAWALEGGITLGDIFLMYRYAKSDDYESAADYSTGKIKLVSYTKKFPISVMTLAIGWWF